MNRIIDCEVAIPSDSGEIFVSSSSELMRNYATGAAVDGKNARGLLAVSDVQGQPVILSIGTSGDLFLIRRDRGQEAVTGWEQKNLTGAFLTAEQTVEAYGAAQGKDGRVAVYAVLKSAGGERALYRTTYGQSLLSADEVESAQWEKHRFVVPGPVDLVSVGGPQDGGEPLVVIAAQHEGKTRRWVLNWGGGDGSAPLLRDAEQVYACLPGWMKQRGQLRRGVFALYRTRDGKVELEFSAEPRDKAKLPPVRIPRDVVAQSATALAVAPGEDGGASDVFLGGEGIWHLPGEKLSPSMKPSDRVEIARRDEVGAIRALAVTAADGRSLWATDADGKLFHAGRDPARAGWSYAAPFETGVGNLTVMRNGETLADDLLLVTTDDRLVHCWRDAHSQLWQQSDLPLSDDGKLQEFDAYTTQITLRDELGRPVVETEVSFESSERVEATINGRPAILPAAREKRPAFRVKSDRSGRITIVHKAATLLGPIFSVQPAGATKKVTVNPATKVRDKLEAVKQPAELRPVVDPNTDPKDVGDVATSLGKLTDIRKTLPADGTPQSAEITRRFFQRSADDPTLVDGAVWGLRIENGRISLLDETEARSLAAAEPNAWSWFGDILRTIGNAAKKAIELTFEAAVATLRIGTTIIRFAVETVGHVLATMHTIIERIGATMKKLIDWAGFVFGWDDILRTHRVFIRVFDQFDVFAQERLESLADSVDRFFEETIEPRIRNLAVPPEYAKYDPAAEQRKLVADLTKKHGDAARFVSDHPAANIASAQFLHGRAGKFKTTFALADTAGIADELKQLIGENESKEIIAVAQRLVLTTGDALRKGSISLDAVAKEVAGDALLLPVKLCRATIKVLLKAVKWLFGKISEALKAEIPVPFLASFYEKQTGLKFNFRDGLLLLAAMTATTGYKLFSNKAPFPKGSYGMEQVGWQQLFGVAGAAETADRKGMLIFRLLGGIVAPYVQHLSRAIATANAYVKDAFDPGCGLLFSAVSMIVSLPAGQTAKTADGYIWIWGRFATRVASLVVAFIGAAFKAIPGFVIRTVQALLSTIRSAVTVIIAVFNIQLVLKNLLTPEEFLLQIGDVIGSIFGTAADIALAVVSASEDPIKSIAAAVVVVGSHVACIAATVVGGVRIYLAKDKRGDGTLVLVPA